MKIAHVTIFTKCMEESVAFYEDMAGLKIQRDLRGTDHPVVFLGSGEEGTSVELVESQDSPYSGCGLLIGFRVKDINEEYRKKEKAGLCPGPLVSPNPYVKFFIVKDPNGVDIQFLQEE